MSERMEDWCGATCETPDGTGLACNLPKSHLPYSERAQHRGWYEGSPCAWSDACARCEPELQATPDAPCALHREIDALAAQLRAQDEALRLAQEALKKAKWQLETLWDLSPGHEGADCPEDDTCECGNVAEFTEAHEATKAALAAIEEAGRG